MIYVGIHFLRQTSLIVKFAILTTLKYLIWCFSCIYNPGQSVSLSNSRTCHPLKRSLIPAKQEPFSSLRQPPQGCIPLSVRSFLLCTFCISGITSVSVCLHLECFQSSSVLEHISLHLFPCLNKIPLSVFTTVCLSIYQLMDSWAVPTVSAIGLCWWGRLCMRFCMNPFSFLLGKYPGVELVVTFLGKCQAASAVAAPFTFTWAVCFTYTSLLTAVIFGFLAVAILASVKGSVIVLSIFHLLRILSIFSRAFCVFFRETLFQILCPLFI